MQDGLGLIVGRMGGGDDVAVLLFGHRSQEGITCIASRLLQAPASLLGQRPDGNGFNVTRDIELLAQRTDPSGIGVGLCSAQLVIEMSRSQSEVQDRLQLQQAAQ